ncbi:MAG TPA: DUF5908 family protein [bacterium]|nr:DUF5908 family protein [bacterium]
MTIEIRELVIRANVDRVPSPGEPTGGLTEAARQELITDCVERVMDILRAQSER